MTAAPGSQAAEACQLDCLIIGGGPAGLTAAVYLARFHLRALVVDEGKSRAALITKSHNLPGFPGGLAGHELLERMHLQADGFGALFAQGRVEQLRLAAAGFEAHTESQVFNAPAVLLATGVRNRRPPIDDGTHAEALRRGHLRYCPVCDGYEVTGQNVAVIGSDERAVSEAEFLRSFTDRLTVVSTADEPLPQDLAQRVTSIGAQFRTGPIQRMHLGPHGIEIATPGGALTYDSVYPALGSTIHAGLAQHLGARVSEDGCIDVDRHQRTSVKNLYAAGDVVYGLDQIAVCCGQAAVAAVAIRNDLSKPGR
jgi:thioredoxin reductase (NADPH)